MQGSVLASLKYMCLDSLGAAHVADTVLWLRKDFEITFEQKYLSSQIKYVRKGRISVFKGDQVYPPH